MEMTYEEGIGYMIGLCEALKGKGLPTGFFMVGELRIDYPGYKPTPGDYRLSIDGEAISHERVVRWLHRKTNPENADRFIAALASLYANGLACQDTTLPRNVKEFIFWITLQEDINYPQRAGYSGRKLPYQRYYEAILAKLGYLTLDSVIERTKNHGSTRPPLLAIEGREHPAFYR